MVRTYKCSTCIDARNNGNSEKGKTEPLPKGLVYGLFDEQAIINTRYYVVLNKGENSENYGDNIHINTNNILILEGFFDYKGLVDYIKILDTYNNQCSIRERIILDNQYNRHNQICVAPRLLDSFEFRDFIILTRRSDIPQIHDLSREISFRSTL